LSLQKIQLFEGNRDTLDEIDPAPEAPRTITEALGAELTEPHQTVASHGHPQVDDLLDDLCELVGKMGGRVMVMPAEQMPGRTGLAAVYRY
jgi:hypothetical protein